jgi:hypothetical protein
VVIVDLDLSSGGRERRVRTWAFMRGSVEVVSPKRRRRDLWRRRVNCGVRLGWKVGGVYLFGVALGLVGGIFGSHEG